MKNNIHRHIEFGSTPNFSNLYKEVNKLTDNAGRLAYAKYNPTLGKPPTEEQVKLLNSYTPELPTLTFRGSEKLHGENMAVCFLQDELWVQGRNHIRTLLDDQNGMAHFVENTKDTWLKIMQDLSFTYSIDTSSHAIVVDCEWAGGNIQKGNAACSGTNKGAYIFDYFRVVSNDTDESQYNSTAGLNVYPNESIYLMSSFGCYEAILDFNKPIECEATLKTLAETIEKSSPIASYFNKPDNVGEGVYLWCTYKGHTLRLKTKGEKHGGKPKKARTSKTSATPEEVQFLQDLANEVTPVWRITQAITETNATEMKHLGGVIKWVIGDVAKEEGPTLTEAGVELKNLSKYISVEVRLYYFNYIKDYN